MTDTLHRALDILRCTVCGGSLTLDESRVVCAEGHSFDVARQGYLNLGASQKDARADSVSMVMAREAVQASGTFDGIADALCEVAAAVLHAHDGDALVADLAGGTGFYTARVLDHHGAAHGIVLDLSVPALKRAARTHSRVAAVGADLTRGVPLHDSSVDLVLNVFGPRNGAEMRRVLTPSGACVVVSPRADHLAELVDPLGMLQVAPDKAARVEQAMQGFTVRDRRECTYRRELTRASLVHIIAMGPSAHHLTDTEISERVDSLLAERGSSTLSVTLSVDLTTFVPEP